MTRPRSRSVALSFAATFLFTAASAAQVDDAGRLPVTVSADVDAASLAATGVAQLRLRFVTDDALDRPYSVRVELRRGGRMVLRRDHAPPTPTREWKPGTPVEYSLPVSFRTPPDGVGGGDILQVFVGFVDPAAERGDVVPPRAPQAAADGLARVASFAFLDLTAIVGDAAVDAVIAEATALAAKAPEQAFDRLEFAFRRVDAYPAKAKLQKALTQVGRMPPPAMTFEEADIVRERIREERARYLRQIAGRLHDRGMLLGALMLLDEVGGALQADADRAVLGALADARRATADRDAIAARVFALSSEQEAEVAKLDASTPRGRERIDVCVKMAKDRARRAVARALVQTLEFTPEHRAEAAAARERIEAAWLADVPPDERKEALAAMNHACWARTTTRLSHRFVVIGPKALVDGIPADSLLRFDLAYLYLTDLFGRVPNPGGDRVTVYWKELWEFGGGVGGGKIIDIGNADPTAAGTRIDTGLLYHELTHCVDDTRPIYGGLREGLADFGAAFAQMELGQVAAGRAAIGMARRAFLEDYLERDLEYWRIPNYGPSAGFLLHFVVTYGKSDDGYRWELYRKFFRDYRKCRVDDARTPTLARAFAFHLVAAFGEKAFDDLIRFRWPLLPGDLDAIRREQVAVGRTQLAPTFAGDPGSPLPRDGMASRLRREDATLDDYAMELGVVRDWHVIGPFRREGVDPDAFRFEPEHEIDLTARYSSINNNPTWRRPGPRPVTVTPTGWLKFEFSYMDDSAIYALTHVTVEQDVEAWFHLRADDDVTLFVDDRLIGKHEFAQGALGPWRPDWRVALPDAIRFPVALTKGRHKVLVKVRNGSGASGLILAIAQRNGTPLPGWKADAEPPAKKLAAIEWPDGRRWPSRFRTRFDVSGAHRKLETPVGKWRVRNGALEGYASEREVEWRKYTVRPGFPKDSPSNLAWLPEKATEQLDAFWLAIDLAAGARAPKLCVIVQGEGRRDALSGWSLILEPHGGEVRAYLERYDQRIHMSGFVPFDVDAKKPVRLEMSSFAQRMTVKLGEHVLFDQAPIPTIPGKHRIGLATWGEALRVDAIELRGPTRTR